MLTVSGLQVAGQEGVLVVLHDERAPHGDGGELLA